MSDCVSNPVPPRTASVRLKCVPIERFDALVAAAGFAQEWLDAVESLLADKREIRRAAICRQIRDRLAAALKGIQ